MPPPPEFFEANTIDDAKFKRSANPNNIEAGGSNVNAVASLTMTDEFNNVFPNKGVNVGPGGWSAYWVVGPTQRAFTLTVDFGAGGSETRTKTL